MKNNVIKTIVICVVIILIIVGVILLIKNANLFKKAESEDTTIHINSNKITTETYEAKIYYQKDSEAFNESIIISKKISDMDVERFAKENIENVDISWLKLSKWKNVDIKCDWITPSFVYDQWKYGMNQYTIYLSEWFLKVGSSVYIISYATLDEKSRNDFSSSFKTIQCK